MKLTKQQADDIEAEIRRLEFDPMVAKRELRLFMQTSMPCGHAVGNLLTCSWLPWGCVECNKTKDEAREAERPPGIVDDMEFQREIANLKR